MGLIFIVLLISFFFFLYILYYLSHDDFVILRKDISLERIFNMAIISSLVSLLFSRLFFAIFNHNLQFFNPLVFLALPYFPGLSLIGGMIGGALFIYAYSNYRKLPVGKTFDLFVISFIGVLPIGFLLTFIVLIGKTSLFFNLLFLCSLVFALLFIKVFAPFSSRGEIKDGTIGLMFLAIFSFIYFLLKLFLDIKTFSFLDLENIALLLTLFASIIIIINQEIMNKFLMKR